MRKRRYFFSFLIFLFSQDISGADFSFEMYERDCRRNGRNVVIYSPSADFAQERLGSGLFTRPAPPREPVPQHILEYSYTYDERSVPEEERLLRRVIPGQDGRQHIQETQWPHSIHAHLRMTTDGKTWEVGGGSGVMVGPHHLLTCGHNVYNFDRKQYVDRIEVYPALNGNIAPFDSAEVVKFYVFRGWVNSRDRQLDMALLLLDHSIGGYTGWGGLASMDEAYLTNFMVSITGYPGDKGCKQMWSMAHTIRTIRPEEFEYEIDTYSGQSGSAVWSYYPVVAQGGAIQNMPVVLGVHTLGATFGNLGVRLSTQKFQELFSKISRTYTLHQHQDVLIEPIQALAIADVQRVPDMGQTYDIEDLRYQQIIHQKTVAFMAFGIDEMPQHIRKLRNRNITYKKFIEVLEEMKTYYTDAERKLSTFLIDFVGITTLKNLCDQYHGIITALEAKIDWIEIQLETEDEEWGMSKKKRNYHDHDASDMLEGVSLTGEEEPDKLIEILIAAKKEYMTNTIQ